MTARTRPLAMVTGASSGIGYELARQCAMNGFDLLVADDSIRHQSGRRIVSRTRDRVEAVEADLSTMEGVDKLYAAAQGRPVDALLANAGRGLGRGFLDQDFNEVRHVIDTNITGTIYLLQKVGQEMRARGSGRILHHGIPSPALYRTRSRPSITAPRRSSTPSRSPCGPSSRTQESRSPA